MFKHFLCFFRGEVVVPSFDMMFPKPKEDKAGEVIYLGNHFLIKFDSIRTRTYTSLKLLYIHFNNHLIHSCNRYFDGIIQQVPFWDFPLLQLVFLKAIILATWQYSNKTGFISPNIMSLNNKINYKWFNESYESFKIKCKNIFL